MKIRREKELNLVRLTGRPLEELGNTAMQIIAEITPKGIKIQFTGAISNNTLSRQDTVLWVERLQTIMAEAEGVHKEMREASKKPKKKVE